MNSKIVQLKATESVKIAYTETRAYDTNGELIFDTTRKAAPSKNGGGFVLSYTEKMCEFLEKTKRGATVRVFLYIAHHQNYGQDGIYGYRCSHKYLRQVLSLDRKSIYNALDELKDAYLVVETKEDGTTEFMVNPNYVTIGQDKKARVREWNARWERVNKQNAIKSMLPR